MIEPKFPSPGLMTHSIVHLLNIGTLATWLSVVGFGIMGAILPGRHQLPVVAEAKDITIADGDFTLGDPGPPSSAGNSNDSFPVEPVERLQDPPELPPMVALTPLPEVPELPSPAVKTAIASRDQPSTAPRSPVISDRESRSTTSRSSGRGDGKGAVSPSGTSNAARLAAGRMPSPSYPAESRRKGQTGTVVVEFTVDSNGSVISAYAKSPSPWQLLNNEAVRTVRSWKFPPGGFMKLQRPIVFQLR